MKMNQKLLDHIRRVEYKRRIDNHETWGHVGGRMYSTAKIFYTIAFILCQMVNITYPVFAISRLAAEGEKLADAGNTRNAVIIVVLGAVMLLIAYILLAMKKPIGYSLFTFIPSIFLAAHFYSDMSTTIAANGIKEYFVKHALWLILLNLTMLVMLIIQIRETLAERREYQYLEAKLYERAKKNGVDLADEQEFERLIERYAGSDNIIPDEGEAELEE